MKQATVTIKNKVGLHARPASLLMGVVNKYDCSVRLEKGDKSCEVKGLIDLMRLQCHYEDELTIICEGADEEVCLEELTALIDSKFGEN